MRFTLLLLVFLSSILATWGRSSLKPALVNHRISNKKRYFAGGEVKQTSSKSNKGKDIAIVSEASPATSSFLSKIPRNVKLLFGAGGIYSAFLYYGALQEDVFHYVAPDGSRFKQAWFLQALEAFMNVAFGFCGLMASGWTQNLPQDLFALSGLTQVSAKAFTSLALAHRVAFPLVTLAKSGKMVPVMIGSLLLGGAKYSLREYASVLAIIAGTVIVSLGNKKSDAAGSSVAGLACIAASLAFDGITGGVQNRLKRKTKELGVKPKPYDFMFWTNLYMAVAAGALALVLGELTSGVDFCLKNPIIFQKIFKFAVCSAIGQSFIFFMISEFDPLVCTTVTTTRKVISVLLSIFLNGHEMSKQGWAGIGLASAGIVSELFDKKDHAHK